MAARIRLRRGTLAEIAASDMASGELCFATDSKQVIASDGTTKFHVSGSSSGLREDRPSASLAGRIYVATDTHESWLDSGTAWLPLVEYGITEGTVCEGDDARLGDARTPTSHTHEEADITDLGTYLELVEGKAPTATLGSGTADNSVFLCGNQTWASPGEIAVPDATASVKGKIQLAGDLGGSAAAPTVVDATAAVKGKIQLAGDLGGTAASPAVTGIHSGATALAISTITDGEVLKRVGTNIVSVALSGQSGLKLTAFSQATSSPSLLLDPPDGAVITRVVVVVDSAAGGGSPTCSIGVSGNEGRDMATTDSDLETAGTYIVEPYTACGTSGANISLTITPDSQTFAGRCYLHYVVPV